MVSLSPFFPTLDGPREFPRRVSFATVWLRFLVFLRPRQQFLFFSAASCSIFHLNNRFRTAFTRITAASPVGMCLSKFAVFFSFYCSVSTVSRRCERCFGLVWLPLWMFIFQHIRSQIITRTGGERHALVPCSPHHDLRSTASPSV